MAITALNSTLPKTTINLVRPTKTLNRATLQATSSQLKTLAGPEEVKKAKKVVLTAVASNTLISGFTAQAAGAELFLLKAVETTMVTSILNGIYGFNFGGALLKGISASLLASSAGQELFRVATKTITWIPVIGNAVNMAVSASVTAALGSLIIEAAEAGDKARKTGAKHEEVIKKMEDFLKKMEDPNEKKE